MPTVYRASVGVGQNENAGDEECTPWSMEWFPLSGKRVLEMPRQCRDYELASGQDFPV